MSQLLLTGRSEKQIAAELRISPHTAHVYVREVYRSFHVQSRPEYMALFVPRGTDPHEDLVSDGRLLATANECERLAQAVRELADLVAMELTVLRSRRNN